MEAWGTTNGSQHGVRRPPTRSMSGDNMSMAPPRKPLISFARSASLAATVPNSTRGLPTPPPLPPLPPELLTRQSNLEYTSQDNSPFAFSAPYRRPLVNVTPKPYAPIIKAPLSPPLPPKPLTKYRLFDPPMTAYSPRNNSPPPPVVPPRPVTAHGAQSSSSLLLARDQPPAVPARPHVSTISPVSDSSDDSWSVVSPQLVGPPPWLGTSTPTITPSRSNRFNFLNLSSKRPHTAASLQSSYRNVDIDPLRAAAPPLPPFPGSMPVINGSNDSEHMRMDADLEHALHLSLTESQNDSRAQRQEDEELAKAIAESLALSKARGERVSIQLIKSHDGPSGSGPIHSRLADSSSSPGNLQIPNTDDKSYLEMNSPFEKELSTPNSLFLDMDDASGHSKTSEDELAVQLQQEETRQMAVDILNREDITRRDAELTKQLQENARKQEEALLEREKQDGEAAEREMNIERSLSKLREAQEQRDAELAQMMARWDHNGQPPPSEPSMSNPRSITTLQSPPRLPTQPLSLDITQTGPVGFAPGDEARPSPPAKSLHDRTPRSTPTSPPSLLDSNNNKSAYATSPNSTSVPSDTSVSRSHSGSSTIGRESSSSHSHNLQYPSPGWSREPSPGPRQVSVSPGGNSLQDSHNINGESTQHQLADLRGFSYGFSPPNIPVSPPQASLACAPFPDIINLSATPYPPFHIMAPSWRHLLRLLAGQETRIQAHIDVIANRKEEQQLRVVVQFVKLAYTANTWRTIIHLSLDEPFPTTVPPSATARFTNGDTTVLPYSYAISDYGRYMTGPNMHIYAIPLSSTSPFPILPITFPKLALYLQSAMKDSRARKVRHDSFRRLAKIVQSCYPEEVMPATQEERKPSRGVGNLIKRVVGRGNSDRNEVTGNEDVFDMITPFRLDQYTTASTSSVSSP